MIALGQHLLMDFYDCDGRLLDDAEYIEAQLRRAAEASAAHVLSATFHRFAPQGVSGVLSLRESHLAIHTWPERRFAAADLFSCGQIDPWPAHDLLKEALRAEHTRTRQQARGTEFPPHDGAHSA